MPLGIALKNQTTIVVAADQSPQATTQAGRLLHLPNRCVIVVAGNALAVEPRIAAGVLPKVTTRSSAAEVAQLMHSVMVLEVVPHLAKLTGRTEVLVAGFDPIRHTSDPGFYYLDSANDFYLTYVEDNAITIGATVTAKATLTARWSPQLDTTALQDLAKECFTATRLRWPTAVSNHLRIATITPENLTVEDF